MALMRCFLSRLFKQRLRDHSLSNRETEVEVEVVATAWTAAEASLTCGG